MVGRDLAVNGNFSFRLSGEKKKKVAFQRMDLHTPFFFLPGSYVLKKLRGVCVCVCVCVCVVGGSVFGGKQAEREGSGKWLLSSQSPSLAGCSSVYEMP